MLKKIYSVITSVFLIACVLFIVGCQNQEQKTVQQSPLVADTSAKVNQAVDTTKKITNEIADIKGKYSGTFDSRATMLNINGQDGYKFKGSIIINYREVTKQQVAGEFDPKTLKFTMADQLHSRYQGKYNGKFSEDKTKMSGTFTMNLDGTKASFNFTKK
jgi:hypothetical protein